MCQWRTHNLVKTQEIKDQERRYASSYCRNLHLMVHLFEFHADVAIKGVTTPVVDNPLTAFGIIYGLVRREERSRGQDTNCGTRSAQALTVKHQIARAIRDERLGCADVL